MKFLHRNKKFKSIPFFIFLSFLLTFIASRIITTLFPETYLDVRGTHIHHFAYGIVLLSIVGYISLVKNLTYYNRIRLSLIFGIALGLAYDEFAMWIQLEDVYHSRTNYDAILTISLTMLSIVFFPEFWKRWGRRGNKLLEIIFISGPKSIFKIFKEW